MTSTEKAIRDFCGHHADWWPSVSQVQEMLSFAQPCKTCEALARTVMMDQTSHDATPPAQPATVQEPVAWAEEIIADLHALYDSEMITENDSGDALIRLDAAVCAVEEAEQRHTTPPAAQRQWVDLTPQDLNKIFKVAITGEGAVHFALAKFKELNT